MSDTRKKIAALVAEKITNLKTNLANAQSTDDKFAAYDSLGLFLKGLEAGLSLSGTSAEDASAVAAAQAHIDTSVQALEAEAALEEALGG